MPGCLTPEDKQRIEEEERRRLAEEAYRAEVRGRLAASQPKRIGPWTVTGLLLLVAFGVYALLELTRQPANPPASQAVEKAKAAPSVRNPPPTVAIDNPKNHLTSDVK